MRAALTALTVLLVTLTAAAAPAPDPSREAKEKLEALKRRLPGLTASWANERWSRSGRVEVRSVRLIGPTRAKATFVSLDQSGDKGGGRNPNNDELFTIFLSFRNGTWSATRYTSTWPADARWYDKPVRFLMLAIDESAEPAGPGK